MYVLYYKTRSGGLHIHGNLVLGALDRLSNHL